MHKQFKYEGLKHGGRILAAAEKYHIAKEEWVDLSTGLNPNGWPVPDVPAEVWQSLPEDDDGLQAAACQYYGCDACLPVAGSQAAIQTLPRLRPHSKVGVISPTYAEHEHKWKHSGHDVFQLRLEEVEKNINTLDVLVVVNPNNPTGEIIEIKKLLDWYQCLSNRGGWLIVDEAFIDTTPGKSLVSSGIKPGLIILRSMGKFFGVAGIRCGFVMGDKELLQRLAAELGPWSLTGPTRYIAEKALLDTAWQIKTRQKLTASSERLGKVLSQAGLAPNASTALFQWVEHTHVKEIYEICAKKGILIRLFEKKTKSSLPSLRFGLPGNENEWRQLNDVLRQLPDFITVIKKKTNNV